MSGSDIEVLDSRAMCGAWVLDQLWEHLGIAAAIRRTAAGRKLDAGQVERVLFALVAQRALKPGSKLAATSWVAHRVAVPGCPLFSDDAAYDAEPVLVLRSPDGVMTTNIAYGGPDNTTLYCTESSTGTVLRAQLDVPGCPLHVPRETALS